MKTFHWLLISLFFINYSCKKNEDTSKNQPNINDKVKYDVNNDSKDDFEIYYQSFTWDGINCSGGGIVGVIEPLNQNAVLMKQNEYTLFNQLNDTIKADVVRPLYWEKYIYPDLVIKPYSSESINIKSNDWRAKSRNIQDAYYLGLLIHKNEDLLVGWLKLKIDQLSGQIQIIDKQFTSAKFIVIDR